MVSTMENVIAELGASWGAEARDFVHYVAEVAEPVIIDEWDQKLMDAFREALVALEEGADRVARLLIQHRVPMETRPLGLILGFYNFSRPTSFAEDLPGVIERSVAEIDAFLERHAEGDDLETRQARDIAEGCKAAILESGRSVAKVLAACHAASGGEAVEVEEEDGEAVAEGENPWHNEDLGIEERMALAKKGGLFEKLFAAMAQTDCTACGYDCEGYAQAIFDGEEKDLGKCAPGEEETQEMIESLVKGGR